MGAGHNGSTPKMQNGASIKYPVIFVPGVCGSKIVAKKYKSGHSKVVWINTSLKASSRAAKYLWGEVNEGTGVYTSYVHEYCDILAKPGIGGVDQLAEGLLLRKASSYFRGLADHLIRKYGYVRNKNLLAYSYDWR